MRQQSKPLFAAKDPRKVDKKATLRGEKNSNQPKACHVLSLSVNFDRILPGTRIYREARPGASRGHWLRRWRVPGTPPLGRECCL